MNNEETSQFDFLERIEREVRSILNLKNKLSFSENLDNKGLDSMNSVKLIISLEAMFNITITDEEMEMDNILTIDKINKLISDKLS
ncbi:acyl carrier protein [Paenibacillus sp. Dod16]|uniref:acyl carrier protein n=1 Tax=Paenibacillus sp. Dod16 TaxID=3416392 RepID=UPI003CF31D94